jgi:signal transduction histidine kinase
LASLRAPCQPVVDDARKRCTNHHATTGVVIAPGSLTVSRETFFEEMRRYVGFGPDDGEALMWLSPHAAPHIAVIVDAFYHRLAQHANARRVLGDESTVIRLKQTLRDWLRDVLDGPWNEAYCERRMQIGRVHVRVGLPQRYMVVAMTSIRSGLHHVVDVSAENRERHQRTIAAVDKILDLDLAIMLESYAQAAAQAQREFQVKRHARLEMLGTLAAGLAHEVRNPLNAANLQLAVLDRRLARQPPDLAGAHDASRIAATEIARLAMLVDDFLKYAKPQPPDATRGDLRETVQIVVEMLQPEATSAGIAMTFDAPREVFASFDPARMSQVVHNLVRNAIEATPPDGTIHVRVAEHDDHAAIEVEDSGPGLPATDAPIFEPFFTTKAKGSGLGLAIVSRIVTDHGGDVVVHRRSGRTVFAVKLPIREGIAKSPD